jgi:replicative DNA helicase
MNTLLDDAEHNVIGSMIEQPRAVIPIAAEILSQKDFYSFRCGTIFAELLEMLDAGEEITFITVADRLNSEEVSAADLVAMSENALPSYVKAHAQIIKRESTRRFLIEMMRQAITDLEAGVDIADQAAHIGNLIRKATDRPVGRTMRELMQEFIDDIVIAEQGGADDDAMETGIVGIDKRTSVLFLKCLVIIAGRPSMGKTALMLNIATHVAKVGKSVLFFSLETRDRALVSRILSSESGINNSRVQTRRTLTTSEADMLKQMAGEMMGLPLAVKEIHDWEKIKATIRSEKFRDENLSLVVIDYCQLIRVSSRAERYLQIGEISSECKALAMELDLCLVLLSQLNRDLEKRQDKHPLLSDLRESGNLEQDADVVLLLHRPCKYDQAADKRIVEIDCAKNRDGATGNISDVRFDESIVKFS